MFFFSDCKTHIIVLNKIIVNALLDIWFSLHVLILSVCQEVLLMYLCVTLVKVTHVVKTSTGDCRPTN